jgi:hypothetical protein
MRFVYTPVLKVLRLHGRFDQFVKLFRFHSFFEEKLS